MKDRGLASPDLGDALAMTFVVKVAARPKREPQLVYNFPSAHEWMGYDGISSYAFLTLQPMLASYGGLAAIFRRGH